MHRGRFRILRTSIIGLDFSLMNEMAKPIDDVKVTSQNRAVHRGRFREVFSGLRILRSSIIGPEVWFDEEK